MNHLLLLVKQWLLRLNTLLPDFIKGLQEVLQGTLPGTSAQYRMAPAGRHPTAHLKKQNPKLGAVLVLLYPTSAGYCFVVTKRQTKLNQHPGQISFAGGKKEDNDPDFLSTAVREAEEEIGISREAVHHLGDLTPIYIPVSNFEVHPCVGWMDTAPNFKLNHDEVASIHEITVTELLDDAHVGKGMFYLEILQQQMEMPCFHFKEIKIWGATSMILSEFKVVLTISMASFQADK